MGRRANDSGVRAPDMSSRKKFDMNRQSREKTGQFNYAAGKKERAVMKAGKGDSGPEANWLLACTVLLVFFMLLAGIIYFFALPDEEEVEVSAE
mmetsp:Transcript_20854/g.49620  ORF Transcript_20854/g.49620 Transcript_20854/m.49620 type:complete len:94 (-) Transcript_20854:76-357(-)